MRHLINMFVILALVITTGLVPSVSHAMPHHTTNAVQQAKASDHEDCHHHDVVKSTADKTVQNDHDHPGKCCDKGICKCISGNCHGMSKIFGNSGNSLSAVLSSSIVFSFSNQLADSALPNRLKRPPKA